MALRRYGVLKGRPIKRRLGTADDTHYHLLLSDDRSLYRASINVRSQALPFDLEYAVVDPFDHAITARLSRLAPGFHGLSREANGLALDYVRGDLFDRGLMRSLAFDLPGPNNDLNEAIDRLVAAALVSNDAWVYVFGTRWGPERSRRDDVFGFRPGNGIHDVHMNQGNVFPFVAQDGVWQDGALLIEIEPRWIAVFLKFQPQAWQTDHRTGHRIDRAFRAAQSPAWRYRRPRKHR